MRPALRARALAEPADGAGGGSGTAAPPVLPISLAFPLRAGPTVPGGPSPRRYEPGRTTVNDDLSHPVDGRVEGVGTARGVAVETVRTALCTKMWTPRRK